jgi:hypothetical protein
MINFIMQLKPEEGLAPMILLGSLEGVVVCAVLDAVHDPIPPWHCPVGVARPSLTVGPGCVAAYFDDRPSRKPKYLEVPA